MGFFGLILLQPTWLANPALWVGLICAACRWWKKVAVCGVLATGFALVPMLLYNPGAAPASHGCTTIPLTAGWPALTQLLPGYSCWLAGMVLFTLGSTLKLLTVAGNRQKQSVAKGDTVLPTSRQTAQPQRTWTVTPVDA